MCRGVESAVQAVAVWGEFGAVIGGIAIWAGAFGCGLAVDAVGEYCWRRVRAGVSVWWVGGGDCYAFWVEFAAFWIVYLSDVGLKGQK